MVARDSTWDTYAICTLQQTKIERRKCIFRRILACAPVGKINHGTTPLEYYNMGTGQSKAQVFGFQALKIKTAISQTEATI